LRRRIVGNLDAEAELGALAALAMGRRRQALSWPALAAIAGAATLLRVFARDGDRLWTPAPVDPARVLEVPGLPWVVLESGPRGSLEPVDAELPWMETPTWPRRTVGAGLRPAPPWSSPASSAGAVARVADRSWGLATAERLGFALPGSAAVSSAAELVAAVAELGKVPWVLKAAFSAAGRDRLHDAAPATRFFARHGRGVVEPWRERLADFGAVGEVGESEVLPLGLHRLVVDAAGRFRGIELTVGRPGFAPGLLDAEASILTAALASAGAALAAAGYRGPFGLDAFRYRTVAGITAFHPWVELNPRLTFGRVARALVERVAGPLGWEPGTVVRLELGRARPEGATLLLEPGLDGSAGAWFLRRPA
jgi:hypothetical protein